MNQKNKLVLFDIDGTLIRAQRMLDNLQRFPYSAKKIFGIDIGALTMERWKAKNFNGAGDRYILWEFIKDFDITKDAFLDRIGDVGDAFAEYLESIKDGGPSYTVIPDAKTLVEKVIAADHLSEGVLTGNLGPAASWKLRSTGLPDIAFGVYGHEADERNDLARLIPSKAKVYFGHAFVPSDIIIIGDTVRDVACARVIGATAVIVATGWEVTKEDFSLNPPDIFVDSLMDEKVLTLLGLHQ